MFWKDLFLIVLAAPAIWTVSPWWEEHEANRRLPPACEEAERGLGAAVPWSPRHGPLAGPGAAQADPARWQPYLPSQPVFPLPGCRPGAQGRQKPHTGKCPRISSYFIHCQGGGKKKGILRMQLKKRKTASRGTAWRFAGGNCYFPIKGHLLQALKCMGLKRRSQIRYNRRVTWLKLKCDLKNIQTPETPSSSAKTWVNKWSQWGSSQRVQCGGIKPRERQPNSFIKNWSWCANLVMHINHKALVTKALLLLKYRVRTQSAWQKNITEYMHINLKQHHFHSMPVFPLCVNTCCCIFLTQSSLCQLADCFLPMASAGQQSCQISGFLSICIYGIGFHPANTNTHALCGTVFSTSPNSTWPGLWFQMQIQLRSLLEPTDKNQCHPKPVSGLQIWKSQLF